MSYEEILGWSQVIAMGIFGSVMAGVLVYALRPGNKARFEAAARLPLDREENIGEAPHGRS
jgi:cytochrome c oxidase cbb3-type subunit 4